MPRILFALPLLVSACLLDMFDDDGCRDAFRDADGDGFGDPDEAVTACADVPPGFVRDDDDCDDANPDVFPGAPQICDGIDNDCSHRACRALSGGPPEGDLWYRDRDRDGYGDEEDVVLSCDHPAGYAYQSGDCDDSDPDVHPEADEVCDGVDNNCEFGVADEPTLTLYQDRDGDTFGDLASPVQACAATAESVADASDCHDADPNIYPGATEICNDLDDDCDRRVDDGLPTLLGYFDLDADGYGTTGLPEDCALPAGAAAVSGDCDDADSGVNPGEAEICYDGVDQNCAPDLCRRTGDLALDGTGPSVYARLEGGKAVGYAFDVGDLDADGRADVVARDETEGLYQIWYGPVVGTLSADTTTQFTFPTSHVAQGGVRFLGDLDGVTGDELGVAAQYATPGKKGRVYLLTDPIPASPASSAYAVLDGVDDEEGLARLGEQTYTQVMDGAGDHTGTGDNHIILGAPDWRDGGGARRGRVWLVDGTRLGGTAPVDAVDTTLYTYDGPRDAAQFGGFVVGLGDVNGDGYDDVGVGEVGSTVRPPEPLFFVYHGSAKPAATRTSSAAELRIGLKGGTYLGFSAAGCADSGATSGRNLVISDQGLTTGSVVVVDGGLTGTQHLDPDKVDGRFALISAPAEVLSLACGDLDVDGDDDVVVQAYLAPPKDATVRAHYGPFTLGTTRGTPDATYDMPSAFPLAVADVGGSASDDIVAAQYRSGVIEVLFGGGE